jgi:hypothetical protein
VYATRINGVTSVVPGPIVNEGDQVSPLAGSEWRGKFVKQIANAFHQFNIRSL